MSGKSVFGSILVSILGSVVIIGLLGYFFLPSFLPDIPTDPATFHYFCIFHSKLNI